MYESLEFVQTFNGDRNHNNHQKTNMKPEFRKEWIRFHRQFWLPVCPCCDRQSVKYYTHCRQWVRQNCGSTFCAVCHRRFDNKTASHERTCENAYARMKHYDKEMATMETFEATTTEKELMDVMKTILKIRTTLQATDMEEGREPRWGCTTPETSRLFRNALKAQRTRGAPIKASKNQAECLDSSSESDGSLYLIGSDSGASVPRPKNKRTKKRKPQPRSAAPRSNKRRRRHWVSESVIDLDTEPRVHHAISDSESDSQRARPRRSKRLL